MTRTDETWHRLRDWTYGQTPSERMSAQVLADQAFTDIDPTHPLGGPDGGKDALISRRGERWIMAVYFPFGQKSFDDIEKKFVADFEGVGKNDAAGMAFVTNQALTDGERKSLRAKVSGPVEIFHLERVTFVLDQPRMAQVRKQFLDIDPAVAGHIDREALLAEWLRESEARALSSWMAVGIPRADAESLVSNPGVGALPADARPDAEEPVVVLSGEMGSGKSLGAERLFQEALKRAMSDDGSPIPVYLKARSVGDDLKAGIRASAEAIGEPSNHGACVVIDGLDEVGYEPGEALLAQARELAAQWPQTTVLITSRPSAVPPQLDEHRSMPHLGEAESTKLLELAAGKEITLGRVASLPAQIQEMLKQPLFALLTGVWMREHDGVPMAAVDLLGELGLRAERSAGSSQALLRALAIATIRNGLAPVPESEVGSREDVERILASGLVDRRQQALVFTLPAMAQWFATQALLQQEVDAAALLESPEDLELWRYPVGLAVALGSQDLVQELLSPLLGASPGFAFRAMELAFVQTVREGSQPPGWRRSGELIRGSLEQLASAVGAVAELALDIDESGRLAPMAVGTTGNAVDVIFYSGAEEKPPVFRIPPGTDLFHDPDWASFTMARVGPSSSWSWQWSRNLLQGHIDNLLKRHQLPIDPNGPMAHEEAWSCALDLTKNVLLRCPELPIDEVLTRIDALVRPVPAEHAVIYSSTYGKQWDLGAVRDFVRRREAEGAATLAAPLPVADRQRPKVGMIGAFYSDDQLVAVAKAIYEQAMVAYIDIVDRWFEPLAKELQTRVLMPFEVIASLNPADTEDTGMQYIPTLAGHLEPLAPGSESSVRIEIDRKTYFDFSSAQEIWERQKAARPAAARWLSGTVGGMSFELGDRNAIGTVVYRWLRSDLQRLGLAKSGHETGNWTGLVSWGK